MIKFNGLLKKIFTKKFKNKNRKFKSFCTKNENLKKEFTVTPFQVKGTVDYMKLVNQFGTDLISDSTIKKFEIIKSSKRVENDYFFWLKRKLFFTHRGFDGFLDSYIKGEKVFLYTGRGPSSNAMHLGHLVPFLFTNYLQEIFDCPVIIQLADEEKSAMKNINFEKVYQQGMENAKEIISIGFKKEKTFIFSNLDYRLKNKQFELLATQMRSLVSLNDLKKIFGFNENSNIATLNWPFYQTCAAFSDSYKSMLFNDTEYNSNSKYKVLIPHAIDQDPYFRLARDISPKMKQPKPNNVMCKFIPPLSGIEGKMSSSENTMKTIFLDDSSDMIIKKVNSSFSGSKGNGSISDHKQFGGNSETDISCKYLEIFESNDEIYNDTISKFEKGEISCSEIKNILSNKLINLIQSIQLKKQNIKESDIFEYFNYDKKLFN